MRVLARDAALVAPHIFDADEANLPPDAFHNNNNFYAASNAQDEGHVDDALSSTESPSRSVWRLLGSSGEAGSAGGQTLHILCRTNATHKCHPENLTIMSSSSSSDIITVQLMLMLMLVVFSFVWAFFCRRGDERRRSRFSSVLNSAASNIARKMSPHFANDLPPAYSKLDLSKESVLSVDDHLNPPPSYSTAQTLVPTIVHVEDETSNDENRRPAPPRRRKTGTNLLFVNPNYLNVPDESLRKASFSSLPMPFDEMINRRLMRRRSFSETVGFEEPEQATSTSSEPDASESTRRHSSIEGALLTIKRRLSYLAFSSS